MLARVGLGHAAEALTTVTEYVQGREVAGAPLSGLQTIRHRVAAAEVELEAARALTYQAADRINCGHPEAGRSVAAAKYFACRAAAHLVDEALQLFGGADYPRANAAADLLGGEGSSSSEEVSVMARRGGLRSARVSAIPSSTAAAGSSARSAVHDQTRATVSGSRPTPGGAGQATSGRCA